MSKVSASAVSQVLHVRVKNELIRVMDKLAKTESRNRPNMLNLLLAEALKARGEQVQA